MSGDGVGDLVEFERGLNGVQYVNLLQNYLAPNALARYPNKNTIKLIEDNSSIYTSRMVKEWFAENPRFRRLNFPAQSPDLNPMKNMWSCMVKDWTPSHAINAESLRAMIIQSYEYLQTQPEYF